MNPDTLVRVANLTVPRRAGRGPAVQPDPLADAGGAAQALGVRSVAPGELDAVRELHGIVVELVDRLIAGRSIARQAAQLNSLARASLARARLLATDGGELRERLEWSDPTPAAALARQVISDLGQIKPHRLRRCGRAQCDLVFYDSTRSNTQRWHAESPCGLRERQQRHRR